MYLTLKLVLAPVPSSGGSSTRWPTVLVRPPGSGFLLWSEGILWWCPLWLWLSVTGVDSSPRYNFHISASSQVFTSVSNYTFMSFDWFNLLGAGDEEGSGHSVGFIISFFEMFLPTKHFLLLLYEKCFLNKFCLLVCLSWFAKICSF